MFNSNDYLSDKNHYGNIKVKKHCTYSHTLPCFSMISTGFCSYRDRCMFIHDRRCKSFGKRVKIIFGNNKALHKDIGFCLFYWPGQSNNSDTYEVSEDRILQSLWHYYILSISSNNALPDEKEYYNHITGKLRLKVFEKLSSNSFETEGEEKHFEFRNSRLPIFQNIVSEKNIKNEINLLSFASG